MSGADVILAHRLPKNSVDGLYYLLVSDAAYAQIREHLKGEFTTHEESDEGFDRARVHVRQLEAQ